MDKIVFIILHYQTIEETVKCIDSIQNNIQNYEIVVVDNASTNHTGLQLKKKYDRNKNIHIILNKQNLGFANGNNVGFNYTKKYCDADFIVMMNNDTIVLSNDFAKIVLEEYEISHFAVLGPKILLKDGNCTPVVGNIRNSKQIKREIIGMRARLLLNCVHMEKILDLRKKKIVEESKFDIDKRYEDIVLHGCCWIFSKQYINLYDGIDERTFLYHEEELLYIRLKKSKLLSVYNPKLKIFHNECATTRAINKNENKKNRFRYKNLIKSGRILYEELKR